MLSVSEHVEVFGDNIGLRGEGIARHQGMPLFVPGLLPGERALVHITEQRKSFWRGELEQLLEVSPERIESGCAAYPACGGCQLQHWAYDAQLRWKQQQIIELFRRGAGLSPVVLPVIAADEPWGSRNKVQLPVSCIAGMTRLGFYGVRSHGLVPLDKCPMQSSLANKALAFLSEQLPLWPWITCYDENEHCGLLRHVLLRSDREDKQLLLVLVLNGEALPHAEEFIAAATHALPELVGIVLNANRRRGNTILGPESCTLWGSGEMIDTIGDLRFYVSATSFFQTNRYLTIKLYETALQSANLRGNELVLEAYCGVGTISAFLARQTREVIGVEINAQAVRDAERNARLNGLSNLRFIEGASEEVLPQLLREGLRPDLVLVDPPRQGCSAELLHAIIIAGIPRLVYISCNPATLVRDIALLAEQGYVCGQVQPIDMFPWTEHVEAACCLTLGS